MDDVFVDAAERERTHQANLKTVEHSSEKINACIESIQQSKDAL